MNAPVCNFIIGNFKVSGFHDQSSGQCGTPNCRYRWVGVHPPSRSASELPYDPSKPMCNLIVEDFVEIPGLHDLGTGRCRVTSCPFGSVGRHPVTRPTGKILFGPISHDFGMISIEHLPPVTNAAAPPSGMLHCSYLLFPALLTFFLPPYSGVPLTAFRLDIAAPMLPFGKDELRVRPSVRPLTSATTSTPFHLRRPALSTVGGGGSPQPRSYPAEGYPDRRWPGTARWPDNSSSAVAEGAAPRQSDAVPQYPTGRHAPATAGQPALHWSDGGRRRHDARPGEIHELRCLQRPCDPCGFIR